MFITIGNQGLTQRPENTNASKKSGYIFTSQEKDVELPENIKIRIMTPIQQRPE